MKKIYLLMAVAIAFASTSNAQFTDDMESYATGPLFTPRWTTWDGMNDGAQNIVITTNQANSGSQSGFIGQGQGPQDAVLDFQGAAPLGSGVWTVQWFMYIPSGNSGYFNVQGNTSPSANDNLQFISGDITFNAANGSPGEGEDGFSGATFTFPHDEWFEVTVECDTDAQTYALRIAGTDIAPSAWNDSGDFFAGIDFFALDAQNSYFVDDVRFVQGVLGVDDFSADVFGVYPNPVQDVLNIESRATVDSVVIYDVLGKRVLSVQPDAIAPSIDVSNLKSGAYMVTVTIGDASKTIKIVK